ncbi:uncharacterized protein CXorf65-like [Saccoglossus kowalevskii]|uniref:Uncharacterized protein LOC100373454 n=1 Tax=Saccoglossus kowalevskii TaxID=10224 RepID=A0ABM0GIP8_SACKO|nr:PREDICTED: uncharacterized protein LOC100373454 [Saccoglossus kowalevskii]
MYITVKFGSNQALLFNPACAVVNLLTNIKARCGYADTDVMLDLSDETGLVKELDAHRSDYADKHLDALRTYILVEKQHVPPEEDDAKHPIHYKYVPLLEKCEDLLPDYKVHVANHPGLISKNKKSPALKRKKPKRPRTRHEPSPS